MKGYDSPREMFVMGVNSPDREDMSFQAFCERCCIMAICRDIKPSNLLSERELEGDASGMHLRLIDFGSALDAFSIHHLYGAEVSFTPLQTVFQLLQIIYSPTRNSSNTNP